MTLSQKLVILRKTKGITQDEFAKALDVSRQSVHKWESGHCFPEVMKLIKIKELFGISIDDLLDDSYEIPMTDKKKRRLVKNEEIPSQEVKSVQKEEAETDIGAPVVNKTDSMAEKNEEPVLEEIAVEVIEKAEKIADTVENEQKTFKEEVKIPSENEEGNDSVQGKKKGLFSKIFGRK